MTWGENQRMIVNGVALEYACHGPAPEAAPTLVLLHEGLGSVALWRDFPAKLAAATGFGVVAYSRAGYGQSDPAELPRPLDYMTLEATEVLPRVLDQLGIQRCVLVGHSDGATIAAIHAGSVVDMRVRGLVLVAPHFFTEPMGLAEISRARAAFETTDLPEKMARYHRDAVATFRGWNDAWLAPGFADWNVADVIDYIRVPVLAIQGREDQYGTLAQIEALTERCYAPVETLLPSPCAHSPFLDQPDVVLTAIAEFCARLARIEAAQVETA